MDPIEIPDYSKPVTGADLGFKPDPIPLPPGGPEVFRNPELFGEGIRPSFGQQLKAIGEQAWTARDSFSGVQRGLIEQAVGAFAAGDEVEPDELNKQFPGMDVPFSRKMKLTEAAYLHRAQAERKDREWVINNGPYQNLIGMFGLQLLSGLSSEVLNPVNAIGNYYTGGLLAGVKAAKYVGLAGKGLGKTLARGAAAGAAENLALEPLWQYSAGLGQEQRTAADIAMNVGIGALAGGVIHTFASRKQIWGNDAVEMASPQQRDAAATLATNQVLNDNKIDVDIAMERARLDQLMESRRLDPFSLEGAPPDMRARPDYEFQRGRQFTEGERVFLATTNNTDDIQRAGRNSGLTSGDIFLGTNVVKLTDSPLSASAVAMGEGTKGRVFEVEAKNWRLIDLDEELAPNNVADPFVMALSLSVQDSEYGRWHGSKYFKDGKWVKGTTRRQLFTIFRDLVRDGAFEDGEFERLNMRLKAAGFDGYRYEGFGPDRTDGTSWGQSNEIVLFDEGRSGDLKGGLFASRFFDTEVHQTPDARVEEIQNFMREQASPESRSFYDPEEVPRVEGLDPLPVADLDLSEVKALDQAIDEHVKSMEAQGLFDAETKAELQKIREAEAELKQEQELTKNAAFCLGEGL